ncbi:hypothetical protein TSMEX_002351, partial [Taenia solium]
EEELASCQHHSVRSEEAYQIPRSLFGDFATLVLSPKMMPLLLRKDIVAAAVKGGSIGRMHDLR